MSSLHHRPRRSARRQGSDPASNGDLRRRHPLRGVALAGALVLGGAVAGGFSLLTQHHAPRPSPEAAGTLAPPTPQASPQGSTTTSVPRPPPPPLQLARSTPVSISIPAIGVHSDLLVLGVDRDGSIEVPPLNDSPATNEAAWFKYSPTPGELGASVIEGHIDSVYQGPSVFFRLGALDPGDKVDVRLADGVVAVFRVDGVREYAKSSFPTSVLYGDPGSAVLRLVTCGGSFDATTHQYLSNILVSARLVSSHR